MKTPLESLQQVLAAGTCTGCGACAALDLSGRLHLQRSPLGPRPDFSIPGLSLPELARQACPAFRLHYPDLYRAHYGFLPENWLVGPFLKIRTGYASDPGIRLRGASGGVTIRTLLHLLESGRIDAAIVVRQGLPTPEEASVTIARNREEILASAQSVYIPVSTLDILSKLEPGRRYAMTCLPDQSAALRKLQAEGFAPARQIHYVLGPYTGTALYPAAIRSLLRSRGVADSDPVLSLQWRAGEWPGHLEIKTGSGKIIRSKKVYYNFLIPFFVTQNSLQNMDFANEFCDLSVGDAWSPQFESQGGGHSIVVTRSRAMEEVIQEMRKMNLLVLNDEDPLKASAMHGHMIDFKKRGGYLRNQWRRFRGLDAPDFGLRPKNIPASRIAVEVVISSIFAMAGTRPARKILEWVPEGILGPLFNNLRLLWKSLSRPTKRKGLANLEFEELPRP